MTKNGSWEASINGDIAVEQCSVGFDDKGRLDITVPATLPNDILDQLKTLSNDFSNHFAVKIAKASRIEAVFHVCRLESTSEEPATVTPALAASGAKNVFPGGRTFHLRYMTA